MTTFGVLRSPRLVLFGAGQRHAISKVVAGYGQRAFICTDARYEQDSELSNIGRSLSDAGIAIYVYTGTIAELPLECIEEAAKLAREFQPEVVIGIGGGSCLDIAKLVALQLAHNGPLSDYYGEFKVPGPVLPLVAIPTTSGTGSEVTPVAVLADPFKDTKVGISSPHLIPQVAICDPELTLTCPRSLTAIAGADALTHAIEAFTAKKKPVTSDIALQQVFVGKNAISDVHALAAIRALAGYLKKSVDNGLDLEAREQVMFGALQAGMAFGMAGTAAAHAIQYPVGAVTHTAHGMGVAALMPYVMQFNLKESIPEFAEIARVFGVGSESDGEEILAGLAIDAVARLLQDIGIPTSLAALGLDKGKATWVAEQAMLAARLVKNNPREIDDKAMARLVDAAIAGDRAALCD